jgi:uncharacterized protein
MAVAPMVPAAAFGHVFRHAGRWFVYDVGTSGLLEVDPALAAVLPLWGPLDEGGIIASLKDRYAPEAIRSAIEEIKGARREEGLFLPRRPRQIGPCLSCHDHSAYATRLSHLTMTVSEQCNLRCRYCLHSSSRSWIRPHRDRAMNLNTALAAYRYFARHSIDCEEPAVSFYGGEPLLQFELIQAVVKEARSDARGRRMRFVIDTNGTLLDDRIVEFLVQEKIHLQISLDGPAELHDRHRVTRQGRGSHARIMEGLARLLTRDPSAAERLLFVVTLAPPYDLEAVADYYQEFAPFRRLGIARTPQLRVNLADLAGLDWTAALEDPQLQALYQGRLDRARSLYCQALVEGRREELSPVLSAFFDQGLIAFHHRQRGSLPRDVPFQGCCLPGQRRLHVKADGAFQPCERVGESLLIGHARSGIDLRAVERLFEGVKNALGERCLDCWALRLCHVCFAALAASYGADGSPDARISEQLCEQVRKEKEETFRLYLTLLEHGPQALDFLANTRVV